MSNQAPMYLDLKKPCRDCPFIPGSSTHTTLEPGRLDGIKVDMIENDKSFLCHKFINKPIEQHCAGAMLFLESKNRPNQLMRFAERVGYYDKDALDYSVDIDTSYPVQHKKRTSKETI